MIPDSHTRKRLWQYLKPYWKLELITFVVMIGLTALVLALPYAVRYMIDTLIPRLTQEAQTSGSVEMSPVIMFGLLLAGIYLANVLFSLVRDYLAGRIGASIMADMRSQLFGHLANVPMRFYQHNQVGEIMSRLMSDAVRMQSLLTTTLLTFLTNVLILIAVTVALLRENWMLTIIAIIPVPLSVLFSQKFGVKLHHVNIRLQETIARLSGRLQESFSAIKTIRAFAQERREHKRLDGVLGSLTGLYIKNSVLNSLAVNLVHFVNSIGPLMILTYGTWLAAGGRFSLGDILMFFMLASYLYSPVQDLATINVEVQSSMASVVRIFEYLDIPPAIVEDPNPVTLAEVRGDISFENVRFAYGNGDFRIQDLSLSIHAGEKLAIVGPSGSGKTTIINLLLRLIDPDDGTITLDGVDIRRLGVGALRRSIGLVDQDPLLFMATVKDNIAYAEPDADLDRVMQAAKIANIHDVIMKLPEGYDHVIGERGVTLSGGEKQRVCLARAILKNPPIMLLDEATSALDTRSEQLIQDALVRALDGKTAIIIAHRLATVRHADRILVMDDGRITDQGTHEQLLESSVLYRELANKQLRI